MKLTKPRKKPGAAGSTIKGNVPKRFPQGYHDTKAYVKVYFNLNPGFHPATYICGNKSFVA